MVKKIIIGLLGFFLMIVAIVIFLEGGLRIYESFKMDSKRGEKDESAYVKVPFLNFRLKPNIKFDDDPSIFRFFHTNFDTNSYGFRKNEPYNIEKPSDIYRIICMGASTTFGHAASSTSATYPAFLKTALHDAYPDAKFEVLNMGIPGFNALQQLILLEAELLNYDPDMIIIYCGWCDITNIFHLEKSRYETIFVGESRFAKYKEDSKNKYFADSKFAILRRIGRWQYKIDKKRHKISDGYKQKQSKDQRYKIMMKSIEEYNKDDFYLKRLINIYKNSLESIVLIAQRRGIEVVLLTLPSVVKKDSPDNFFDMFKNKFTNSIPFVKGDPYTEMRLSMQGEFNNIIRGILQRNECILVDTDRFLPRDERVFDLFSDEIHFNDKGNQFLAELVASTIKNSNIFIDSDKK